MRIDELIDAFRETGGECPLLELEAFERTLGASLPDEYRDFLLSCNGGHSPALVSSTEYTAPCLFWGFDYPPRDPEDHPDDTHWTLVEQNLDCYEGRIPEDAIAFGDDVFGNLFLIGTRGEVRGHVYYWDHEEEHLNYESRLFFWKRWNGLVSQSKNTVLLANSFNHYIGTLKLEQEQ